MSRGKSCWSVSVVQCSNAILKTTIPASAVRLAAGSSTPRWRNESASAEASDASLMSSRSVERQHADQPLLSVEIERSRTAVDLDGAQ